MSPPKLSTAADHTNQGKVPLWRIDRVHLAGPGRRLDSVTLEIVPGVTALLGASGAGKTSLLNLLVKFEYPTSGTLSAGSLGGEPLRVGWVPQSYSLWPHLTVAEHLRIVSPQPLPRESLTQWLAEWDLLGVATSYPQQLSAGQQARLSIVRALVSPANVLVMDEPFANVDPVREVVYRRLMASHLSTTGRSLVFASHNIEAVYHLADRVICLSEGRVHYHGRLIDLHLRPASRDQAEFLGPINWMEPDTSLGLLEDNVTLPIALRPEQVWLEPSRDSPWCIVSWRFLGCTAMATIRHGSFHWEHHVIYTPPIPLTPGQSVKLRVREGVCPPYEELSQYEP